MTSSPLECNTKYDIGVCFIRIAHLFKTFVWLKPHSEVESLQLSLLTLGSSILVLYANNKATNVGILSRVSFILYSIHTKRLYKEHKKSFNLENLPYIYKCRISFKNSQVSLKMSAQGSAYNLTLNMLTSNWWMLMHKNTLLMICQRMTNQSRNHEQDEEEFLWHENQDVCGWDGDREKQMISLHFMWYFFSFLNWTDLGLHGSQ